MTDTKADIGLIGLGALGQSLILNLADHGYTVVAYNRTVGKVDDFLRGAGRLTDVMAARSLQELIGLLTPPRKVVLTVTAGDALDELIEQLVQLLERGDLVVDAGNSHFTDTARRAADLESHGMLFIGAGISGAADGARRGASIMLGGSSEAWPLVRDMFQSISARSPHGDPCCGWIGAGGAGHYVKMVHNGIEYADMQLLSEAYHLLGAGLGLAGSEMHEVFTTWKQGDLDSYLVAITADILAFADEDGEPLVDKILDAAEQKGTGRWTGVSSLELGVPATLIDQAVHARYLSALKADRVAAAGMLTGPNRQVSSDRAPLVEDIRQAVVAARIVSHAQAFMLLRRAADEYGWNLSYGAIAALWQGGCIVRSVLLEEIETAFEESPDLRSLILSDGFRGVVERCQPAWRRVVVAGVELGLATPVLSAALTFYDGYRSAQSPANLLQAQRDYFSGHGYERVDRPRGQRFHTDWTR